MARKKEMYRVELLAIQRIAGRLGLKLGARAECPGDATLGIGIIGGADWGPWGLGSRASSEVASSIVYFLDMFSHVASSARKR